MPIEKQLTLIQKLSKIREICDVVTRDKAGYKYMYADITSILAKITAGMKKYGVSLIPEIIPETVVIEPTVIEKTKTDKQGNSRIDKHTEMIIRAEMRFIWIDNTNPSDKIIVPWILVGSQEDPSQAFGSALTYCTRYFLTSYFQIAQPENDVDEFRSKQKEAEEAEDKAIAAGIIKEFDTKVRTFMADNPDKSDEVKEFISRYVKNANYTKITDPAIANKLITDFGNGERFLEKDKK